jgi:hypothetical protein
MAKSRDITDAKGGKVSNLLYTETNIIHNKTPVNFVLGNVNKKYSVKILSPGIKGFKMKKILY